MSSGRRPVEPSGPADGRVSIFRRVLNAQRLARHGPNVRENGHAQADVDADKLPTERESAAFAAAQESATSIVEPASASAEPESAALLAEVRDLRERFARLEALEKSLAAAQQQAAVYEAEAAAGRETATTLRAELDAARETARSSTERLTGLERDLAAAITELARVPAILEEAERLRLVDRDVESLRALVSEAEEQRAAASSRAAAVDARVVSAETRAKSAELRAKKSDESAKSAQARIEAAQAQAKTADARATSAEDRVADLEASQRDAERRHDEELTKVRAQNRAPERDAGELARLAAEVESLRSRVSVAEEAVAAALREFGVEPHDGPLTAADVVRAVGPLTLHALGEGTPGWAPNAPEDTLAAAVLTLAQKAAQQQRRLDRLSGALEKSTARR